MNTSDPGFYDNPLNLQHYLQRRNTSWSANNILERPAFLDMLPSLVEKNILDLGCGEARLGNVFVERGAKNYRGIDASQQMIALAQHNLNKGRNTSATCEAIETFSFEPNQYDVIISQLAFHYVEDLEKLFKKIHNALPRHGTLLFSVEHPIMTSHQLAPQDINHKKGWLVDNYFKSGSRNYTWLGGTVQKYHRTLTDYFRYLYNSGFVIEDLCEPSPSKQFKEQALFEKYASAPIYLLIRAVKNN